MLVMLLNLDEFLLTTVIGMSTVMVVVTLHTNSVVWKSIIDDSTVRSDK